ncbi:MAG: HAD family hydrolase [Thermosynechococcaceae cyanobacterium MS004]|nr:HAD family hydrolase [Thermosynechococcaceae cyanobacterium MS004]
MVTLRAQGQTFDNIQAIIFDKDGTLANVESYLKSLGQKRARLVDAQVPGVQEPLLLAFGVESTYLNPMGLMAVGSRRESIVAAAAYVAETGRDWAEALEIAIAAFTEADSYLKNKAEHTPLFPALQDWLPQLATAGLQLGVLSADTPQNVEDFVKTYQLQTLISRHQGVDGLLSKPDPRLYEAICQQLDVPPSQTLMIGDSTLDMRMAQAAGSAGRIGVTWGWQKPVIIDHADLLIDQPHQLEIL